MNRSLKVVLAWSTASLVVLGGGWRLIGAPGSGSSARGTQATGQAEGDETLAVSQSSSTGIRLPAGQFLVGADKTSLYPQPQNYTPEGDQCDPGPCENPATWEKRPSRCDVDSGGVTPPDPEVDPNEPHVRLFTDSDLGWPGHNPNCIYLGGFDIGPVRGATGVHDLGVWARSIAISNGENTVIFQVLDTVGYFARYRSDICDSCGLSDIRQEVSDRLGLGGSQFVSIASTHTHGGADTYGGWGGVPKWYYHQMRDAAIASAEAAVANMEDARIVVGSVDARNFNNERRDHYYSTPDYWALWLQAQTPEGAPIATLINHAAHPTQSGSGNTLLHPDWPGALNNQLEVLYPGSVGLTIEGGLGNVSAQGSMDNMSKTFSRYLAGEIARTSTQLQGNQIAAAAAVIEHPVTNWGELGLSAIGAFDREFTPESPGAGGPMTYSWEKGRGSRTIPEQIQRQEPPRPEDARSCFAASPASVRTPIAAYRIGELNVFTGPGELFSNLTEVIKSKARNNVETMVFGNTNDALGYIIQSFEFDRTTSVVTEYGTQTAEYEEVFALDACFGDHVLDTMLQLRGAVGT